MSATSEPVIRPARPDDNDALCEISRVPLQLGDATLVIDRGDDFFAPYRLQQDSTVIVAEVEGRPVGVYAGMLHTSRIDGKELAMLSLHQCRLAPDFQRSRLFMPLAERLMGSYHQRYDVAQTFIHPDNDAARRLTVVDPWTVRPMRALLPCTELAGPPAGRVAAVNDVALIANVLNAFHGREELYVPFTPRGVAVRLGRCPELYGLGSVIVGNGAAVGMWAVGERRRWQRANTTDETVRAWVMDYGCLPGAEDELEALLRDRCRVASESGMTHLAVFTSEMSASRPLLDSLATSVEPYDLRTAFVPEPPGAAVHGIHVDPLYF